MRCICQNCGKKHESKDLMFDFSTFLKETIKEKMKELDSGERREMQAQADTLFNVNKDDWMVSEHELWECKKSEKKGNDKIRYIKYEIPYEKMKNAAEQNGVAVLSNLDKWLSEKIDSHDETELQLEKTGDGDIRFNIVRKEDGSTISNKRLCPDCNGEMSYWSGRYREIVLSVLGGPRVSKSTTLTACAYAFRQGGKIRWEEHKEDSAWKSFNEDYLEKYKKGLHIEPTDTNEDKIPRICFRVNIDGRYLNLTFVDIPGEFNGTEVSDQVYKKYQPFYNNIDFIWYCTDPGEINQVDGAAKDVEELKKLGYEKDKRVLTSAEIRNNMETLSGFFNDSERQIPVAYIVGKTDSNLIDPEEKEKYHLFEENEDPEVSVYNLREEFTKSKKVREYLEKKNRVILEAFEKNFSKRFYFAVSAYGFDPRSSSESKTLRAFNCKQPFYWMLAIINCLEIKVVIRHTRWLRKDILKEEVQMFDTFQHVNKDTYTSVERNIYMKNRNYTI